MPRPKRQKVASVPTLPVKSPLKQKSTNTLTPSASEAYSTAPTIKTRYVKPRLETRASVTIGGDENAHVRSGKPVVPGKNTRVSDIHSERFTNAEQSGSRDTSTRDRGESARPVGRAASIGPSSRRLSINSRLHSTPLSTSTTQKGLRFRKRARQPSLLDIARAHKDGNNDTDLSLDLNLDDDFDLHNYQPDDESTPLVKSYATTSEQLNVPNANEAVSSPHAKKTSNTSTHGSISVLGDDEAERQLSGSDPLSDSLHSVQLPAYNRSHSETPSMTSGTLAPPESSSPSVPVCRPEFDDTTKDYRPHRIRTRIPVSNHDETVTPPISQISHPKEQAPTTASLQTLLPRRRRRKAKVDSFDIDDDSDISIETDQVARKRQKTRPKQIARISKSAKNPKPSRTSQTYGRSNERSSSCEVEGDHVLDAAKQTKTHSRGAPVNGSEDGLILDATMRAEMQRMAQKFKLVDDYDMDFEEFTANSSQLKDAR